MDKKIQELNSSPNYHKIYTDIISKKYPEKKELCHSILNKGKLCVLDIMKLNQIIFENKNEADLKFDQQHRSYDRKTIEKILLYMENYNLNNSQVARHFNLSRNTVAKWKKLFVEK